MMSERIPSVVLNSFVYGIRHKSKCFQDLSVVNKTRQEKSQNKFHLSVQITARKKKKTFTHRKINYWKIEAVGLWRQWWILYFGSRRPRLHYPGWIWKRNNHQSLLTSVWKNTGRKTTWEHRFKKTPFSKCLLSTRKRKADVFTLLRFRKSVFEKLRFSDGLVKWAPDRG